MKKKTLLLFLFFFFIHFINSLKAQTATISKDSLTSQFSGKWYLRNSFPAIKDSLVFEREVMFQGMGSVYIDIKANGDFIDVFNFPGGEESINHDYKGNWTFDPKTMLFTTTIPVCEGYKLHKLRIEKGRIIMKNIKN